jgi:hypothetical protein
MVNLFFLYETKRATKLMRINDNSFSHQNHTSWKSRYIVITSIQKCPLWMTPHSSIIVAMLPKHDYLAPKKHHGIEEACMPNAPKKLQFGLAPISFDLHCPKKGNNLSINTTTR